MERKRYRPEKIVAKLRSVEPLRSKGMVVAEAVRLIGVSEVGFYRWRKEYGAWAPTFLVDQPDKLSDAGRHGALSRKGGRLVAPIGA